MNPKSPSLRSWNSSQLEELLKEAHCQSLSHLSTNSCDAYLLSESSLFVWDHRLTMITCGQTHLINAAFRFLDFCSEEDILSFIYQRKNEYFPFRQQTSFYEDIKKLDGRLKGKAFCFGKQDGHHMFLFHKDKAFSPPKHDMTLEVLMYHVGGKVKDVLKKGKDKKNLMTELLDFGDLFKGFQTDDHHFDPHGYSLNAVKDGTYYTIHITPEDMGSYISFETNVYMKDPEVLVRQVIDKFSPESFDVIIFSPEKTSSSLDLPKDMACQSRFFDELDCGYHLAFYSYIEPSKKIYKPFPIDFQRYQ